MNSLSCENLKEILSRLSELISLETNQCFELVVCGGSALIALGLIERTTRDIDVVAVVKGNLFADPEPLPAEMIKAAARIAQYSDLPADWLNTGPADIFRMGLPDGFGNRLVTWHVGRNLVIHFISRLDQIHFKLYAAVDRGGYHITDLMALNPCDNEILQAARWARTHDVSDGFKEMLEFLLKELGYERIIAEL